MLPDWLGRAYARLWASFGTREFSFWEALHATKLWSPLIYRVLAELHQRGWLIRKRRGRRAVYRLRNPELVFRAYGWFPPPRAADLSDLICWVITTGEALSLRYAFGHPVTVMVWGRWRSALPLRVYVRSEDVPIWAVLLREDERIRVEEGLKRYRVEEVDGVPVLSATDGFLEALSLGEEEDALSIAMVTPLNVTAIKRRCRVFGIDETRAVQLARAGVRWRRGATLSEADVGERLIRSLHAFLEREVREAQQSSRRWTEAFLGRPEPSVREGLREVLEEVGGWLNELNIRYVLVGGAAVELHVGIGPYRTQDIDFEIHEKDVPRVLNELRKLERVGKVSLHGWPGEAWRVDVVWTTKRLASSPIHFPPVQDRVYRAFYDLNLVVELRIGDEVLPVLSPAGLLVRKASMLVRDPLRAWKDWQGIRALWQRWHDRLHRERLEELAATLDSSEGSTYHQRGLKLAYRLINREKSGKKLDEETVIRAAQKAAKKKA